MPEEDDEEACDSCQESAGVIVSDEICQSLQENSDINCKDLIQEVLDKKITPREYMDTLIKTAEDIDDPKNANTLKKIRGLMEK